MFEHYSTDAANKAHGFIDNNGAFTNIDFPGAYGTVVFEINAHGVMVGVYQATAMGGEHASSTTLACLP